MEQEHLLRKSLEGSSWPQVKAILDSTPLDQKMVDELKALILRCTGLVYKRADSKRLKARASLFVDLTAYVTERAGSIGATKIVQALEMLELIESGYGGILILLNDADISKLTPPKRAWACVERTCYEAAAVTNAVSRAIKATSGYFDPQNLVVKDEEGTPFHADGAMTLLVETLTMNLIMESYNENWVTSGDDRIVLPAREPIEEEDRFKAGSTMLFAASWRNWQRMEERARYFGGAINRFAASQPRPEILQSVPADVEVIAFERDMTWDSLDFVANERLNTFIFQQYMQMLTTTNVEAHAKGIDGAAPMFPASFVTVHELHAAQILSQLLGFPVHEDTNRYEGLRLVEWIRGFAILRELVNKQSDKLQTVIGSQLIHILSRTALHELFIRLGFAEEAAAKFIDMASLRRSSRDLFDAPLISVGDDQILIIGPALQESNLSRVVLSAIANHEATISRKGFAFEGSFRRFMQEQGLECKGFTAHRDGEEYEFDAVVPWGDYVFLFDAKCQSISSNNPAASYYFSLKVNSDAAQVKRLASALERYPDILTANFPQDLSGKKIVPCIVNAMPFSLPGAYNGVYFTDMSAVSRFFEARHLRLHSSYQLDGGNRFLHRVGLKALWAGDKPTAEDLIRQLDKPIQVAIISERLALTHQFAVIGEKRVGVQPIFHVQPESLDEMAVRLGADPRSVRSQLSMVRNQLRQRGLLKGGKGTKKPSRKKKRKG